MKFVKIIEAQQPQEIDESGVNNFIKTALNTSVRKLSEMPPESLQEWLNKLKEEGIFELTVAEIPEYDENTHKLEGSEIVQIEGVWTKRRLVVPLTQQELDLLAEKTELKYERDLLNTAGITLIKYMNGEATQQDFNDVVDLVKTLHGKQ